MYTNHPQFSMGIISLFLLLFCACTPDAGSHTDTDPDTTPAPIPTDELVMPAQFSMHLKFEQPYNPYLNAESCWTSEESNFYYTYTDDRACMKAEFNGFCPPLPGAPQLNTSYSCWIYAMRYTDPTDQTDNYASYYVQLDADGTVLSCCAFTPDIGPIKMNFVPAALETPWLLTQIDDKPGWATNPPTMTEINGTPAELILTSNQSIGNQDADKQLVQGNFGVSVEPTQVGENTYHAPLYIAGHSPWLIPDPAEGKFVALNLNPEVPDTTDLYKTAFGRMYYYDFQPQEELNDSIFDLPTECDNCQQLMEGPATPENYARLKAECSCYDDGMIMYIPPALPGTGNCSTCHHASDKWQALLTDSTYNVRFNEVWQAYFPHNAKVDSAQVEEIIDLFRNFESPCAPGPTVILE